MHIMSPLHLFVVVVLLSFLLLLFCYHQLQTINHPASSYYLSNAGYLGYTSGFSLSCMVFFLISVSLGYRASKHTCNTTSCSSNKCLSLINRWALSSQVIYKKFNTLCPLGDDHDNITVVDDHTVVNSTDDFCEAKLFTMNSQVRGNAFSHRLSLVAWVVSCIFVFLGLLPRVLHCSMLCQQH